MLIFQIIGKIEEIETVVSNIGEAWRKRRYQAHFVSKLSDSEGEAEETRVWLEFSWRCGYLPEGEALELDQEYDRIIGQLVLMIDRPDQWLVDTDAIRRAG